MFMASARTKTRIALDRLPVRVASMRETAGMRSAAQKQVQRIAYSLAHHVVAHSNAVREKAIGDGVMSNLVRVQVETIEAAPGDEVQPPR